jgi:hypothetical protein
MIQSILMYILYNSGSCMAIKRTASNQLVPAVFRWKRLCVFSLIKGNTENLSLPE